MTKPGQHRFKCLPKRLALFMSTYFLYLRTKMGCYKLTQQVLNCICAVQLKWYYGTLLRPPQTCLVDKDYYKTITIVFLKRTSLSIGPRKELNFLQANSLSKSGINYTTRALHHFTQELSSLKYRTSLISTITGLTEKLCRFMLT
jgi:hypothetical protein